MKTALQFAVIFFTYSLFLLTTEIHAQATTLKLSANNNTSSFEIQRNDNLSIFKVFGDGGLYSLGNITSGAIPTTGEGTRLMWYPKKAAFRVGGVTGDQWDDTNTGFYSVAMGYNSIASGLNSISIGIGCIANQSYAIAMGFNTTASSSSATALGSNTVASGNYSLVWGFYSTASGGYSAALGDNAVASGHHSVSIGSYVSTNNFAGAFILGDNSGSTTHNSSANNEMTMRFAGGYRLFTDAGASIGVKILAGGNSWSAISDSTKKENFIKAEGESFLTGISKLRLGSWNYKVQNSSLAQNRHYGPMAQEIFNYFGKDGLGTIGNDTTLASADMDGIIMICLQALEKRTNELVAASEKINQLETAITSQDKKIINQEKIIDEFRKELNEMRELVLKENKSADNVANK